MDWYSNPNASLGRDYSKENVQDVSEDPPHRNCRGSLLEDECKSLEWEAFRKRCYDADTISS
jgi:hypothetical protein